MQLACPLFSYQIWSFFSWSRERLAKLERVVQKLVENGDDWTRKRISQAAGDKPVLLKWRGNEMESTEEVPKDGRGDANWTEKGKETTNLWWKGERHETAQFPKYESLMIEW